MESSSKTLESDIFSVSLFNFIQLIEILCVCLLLNWIIATANHPHLHETVEINW